MADTHKLPKLTCPTREVAAMLGVSRPTVTRLVTDGRLPSSGSRADSPDANSRVGDRGARGCTADRQGREIRCRAGWRREGLDVRPRRTVHRRHS